MSRVKYMPRARAEKLHIETYPNFHVSGSITGMRKIYGKDALLVRSGSWIYHVPRKIYDLAD